MQMKIFLSNQVDKDRKKQSILDYFFRAHPLKTDSKIYSFTQCSLAVNGCDWHILADNDERIKSHCLTRFVRLFISKGVSQCYFVHRQLNNARHYNAHLLTSNLCSSDIRSYLKIDHTKHISDLRNFHFCPASEWITRAPMFIPQQGVPFLLKLFCSSPCTPLLPTWSNLCNYGKNSFFPFTTHPAFDKFYWLGVFPYGLLVDPETLSNPHQFQYQLCYGVWMVSHWYLDGLCRFCDTIQSALSIFTFHGMVSQNLSRPSKIWLWCIKWCGFIVFFYSRLLTLSVVHNYRFIV